MSEQLPPSRNVIVVGADLQETGEFALREAMRLARQLPNAELHAVYVIETSKNLHDAKKIDALSESIADANAQLRVHVTKACSPDPSASAFDHAVTLHVRLGAPAEAIHQVAVDLEADLIVVGTHARTGLKRWVLGSVAENLMRIARAPVVIAHPKHYEGQAKSPRVQPPRPGQDLSDAGSIERVDLHFAPRTTHISGMV
jgi:nucleotide-binding universal stress UspA family protein